MLPGHHHVYIEKCCAIIFSFFLAGKWNSRFKIFSPISERKKTWPKLSKGKKTNNYYKCCLNDNLKNFILFFQLLFQNLYSFKSSRPFNWWIINFYFLWVIFLYFSIYMKYHFIFLKWLIFSHIFCILISLKMVD